MTSKVRTVSIRFVFFMVTMPIVLIGLLYFGHRWFLRGLFLWCAMAFITVLWHLVMRFFIRIDTYSDSPLPEKGQTVSLFIRIRNRSLFPILWGRVEVRTVHSLFDRQHPSYTFCLPPFSRQTFMVSLRCPYRGVFTVGVNRLALRDPFGFLTLVRSSGRSAQYALRVWPQSVSVPDLVKNDTVLEEKTSVRRDFSEDLSSVHQIRDWRDGDTSKRIHWKLTNRMQTLMVKEFDGLAREEIVIYMDTSPRYTDSKQYLDQVRYEDALIEATYSIITELLRHNRPLRLSVHLEAHAPLHGSALGDIDRFHNFLAFVTVNGSPGLLNLMLDDRMSLPGGGSLIIISGLPDGSTTHRLLRLQDEGLHIIYIAAIPDYSSADFVTNEMSELRRAGILCLSAHTAQGLQEISIQKDTQHDQPR